MRPFTKFSKLRLNKKICACNVNSNMPKKQKNYKKFIVLITCVLSVILNPGMR